MTRHLPALFSLVLVWQPACSDSGGTPALDVSAVDTSGDGTTADAAVDGWARDAPDDAPAPDLAPGSCPTYASPVKAGTVTASAITETSGIEVSSANPGVIWLHNDSGDSPRVFAISSTALLLGEYALSGASAADWEDMALGPGPQAGKSYLYLGDIGDNPSARGSIAVYRVEEPVVPASGTPVTATLSGVETLTFVYPDGSHNAETLLADPGNGDLYIVTKTGASPAGIYRSPAPQSPGTRTLTKVGTVSLGTNITGGDIADDGTEVLLRTYGGAHLFPWPAGAALSAALAATPCTVPAALEPQGEAIAFAPQSKDYFTLSELSGQPLYHYVRQ